MGQKVDVLVYLKKSQKASSGRVFVGLASALEGVQKAELVRGDETPLVKICYDPHSISGQDILRLAKRTGCKAKLIGL